MCCVSPKSETAAATSASAYKAVKVPKAAWPKRFWTRFSTRIQPGLIARFSATARLKDPRKRLMQAKVGAWGAGKGAIAYRRYVATTLWTSLAHPALILTFAERAIGRGSSDILAPEWLPLPLPCRP